MLVAPPKNPTISETKTIKEVVESCPIDVPLEIRSDSKISLDGLTKNLASWEAEGFLRIANGDLFRTTVSKLRRRKAETRLTWVNTKPDSKFIVSGAKLNTMTQSKAYKLIRERKMKEPAYKKLLARKATRRNMKLAQNAAAPDTSEDLPSEGKVWKSIRHKDLSRPSRFFLWMLIHGGYKVGYHWEKIPGHEHKMECDKCGVPETTEHILTRCDAPGQDEVWQPASELWERKTGAPLPKPTTGQIMSCAAIKIRDARSTRLYRLLISESAHLIWRMRNERVIQEKGVASTREIYNCWLKMMNNRLELDRAMTNDYKYGKKAIKKMLVLKMWSKVLKDEDKLPEDWTWETEVLVGIG
ncbi:hypothetical protein B0H17DRAFT_1156904 [Mycena rosella]|uniref:Reverse transcriptase zinc-binding domain-containing protein n=1 Tax=Mycena rosella TaxID=1033263 RepID=A0AAD7GTC3_MYCRO|nr:hypothetical protein B0H17DRAFT_1156904 [Mycena rosella]